MRKDQIIEAYQFRHACKEFDAAKKITVEDFDFIMETARLSPSSFGFEPWNFLVLQDPTLREKLLPVAWGAQKQLPTASHFVIILARTKQEMAADSEYIQHIMKDTQDLPENVVQQKGAAYDHFLKNDFSLFDDERVMFQWASRQTYIALGNMMTSAAMIGIDSCPIEGFAKEKVEDILAAEGLLDRERFGVACMVAFGYRKNEPRAKTRQAKEEIIRFIG
ncbi:NAD(P)H-dependent oxidoreductase [Brevibacillus antibioticus]|uniref:NAD(P)H-dependent oxidoreductase n=1 Tax=Brevibacillus antibioticus TaxID=2570228 RepID=A0A4U2YE23_9BACL|nr:NAD(P)H-dependent oxidoreductase [Brevibacillus antibioticus]TKI58734.1 NAD(P)H-dependent oxidoreductase [Brevibacillus antibioticus]